MTDIIFNEEKEDDQIKTKTVSLTKTKRGPKIGTLYKFSSIEERDRVQTEANKKAQIRWRQKRKDELYEKQLNIAIKESIIRDLQIKLETLRTVLK